MAGTRRRGRTSAPVKKLPGDKEENLGGNFYENILRIFMEKNL